MKRVIGGPHSTGDAFVVPVLVGMIIGRPGYQLSDARDLTYGTPTTLPWGWDYGDGVLRHSTAFYEILELVGMGWITARVRACPSPVTVPGCLWSANWPCAGSGPSQASVRHDPRGCPCPGCALGPVGYSMACVAGLAYYAPDGA